jgi:PAS domain S-box-containing protein
MNLRNNKLKTRKHILELEESEQSYQKLLQLAPDPILIHSQNKIVFINNSFLKEFGVVDKEQLIGASIETFMPDEMVEHHFVVVVSQIG